MDIRIHLNSEIGEQLREHVAANGTDVSSYVEKALRAQMDSETQPAPRLSSAEWVRWLDEFVASHGDIQHTVDDSRESMYDDRGA